MKRRSAIQSIAAILFLSDQGGKHERVNAVRMEYEYDESGAKQTITFADGSLVVSRRREMPMNELVTEAERLRLGPLKHFSESATCYGVRGKALWLARS